MPLRVINTPPTHCHAADSKTRMVREWRCDVCSKWFVWSSNSRYYGSLADRFYPEDIVITCSESCRIQAADQGRVPKDAEEIDDT